MGNVHVRLTTGASLPFPFLLFHTSVSDLYVRTGAWFFCALSPFKSYYRSTLSDHSSSNIYFRFYSLLLDPCSHYSTTPISGRRTREQMKIFARQIFRFDCWILSFGFLIPGYPAETRAIYFSCIILHGPRKAKRDGWNTANTHASQDVPFVHMCVRMYIKSLDPLQ